MTEPVMSSGTNETLQLLITLGSGLRHLSQYRTQEAVDVLSTLPPEQYNTGWVLAQVGRAFFEMAKYRKVRCPGWSVAQCFWVASCWSASRCL